MDKRELNDIRSATKWAGRKIKAVMKKVEEGNYEKASEYLRETAKSLTVLADELDIIVSHR